MTEEYLNLRNLLVRLPDFQKKFENYNAKERQLLEFIAGHHGLADSTYLESKLKQSVSKIEMSEERRFIFLTPFQQGTYNYLPLLSVDMDFTLAWPSVSIHALLYGLDRTLWSPTVSDVKCFGYRYDKPAARVGDHNYFHVQFTHGTIKNRPNRFIADWISLKDPAIPVDATDSVELFLSAVIAVRNSEKPRKELFDEWSQSGIPIGSLLQPMAFGRWTSRAVNAPAAQN